MAEQHTPGPWFSDCHDEVCATLDGGAVVVIALANPMAELNAEAEIANARLIAAAPELFHEVREICAILDNYHGRDGQTNVYDYEAIGDEVSKLHQRLTDAIAKAAGAA